MAVDVAPMADDPGRDSIASAIAAKEAGNEALKAANLPLAIERYEESLASLEAAVAASEQQKALAVHDIVRYDGDRYARVDTAFPAFGDYLLLDLATNAVVEHAVSHYERVPKRFKRSDLTRVQQDVFDLRLACLQNLSLASLKNARGSKRERDFEDTVARADSALAMDGQAVKALMRKGAALMELKRYEPATQALAYAYQGTRGKDAEVTRLLEECVALKGKAKGKGGGKGRGKGGNTLYGEGHAKLREVERRPAEYSSSEEEEGDGDGDEAPARPAAGAGRRGDVASADCGEDQNDLGGGASASGGSSRGARAGSGDRAVPASSSAGASNGAASSEVSASAERRAGSDSGAVPSPASGTAEASRDSSAASGGREDRRRRVLVAVVVTALVLLVGNAVMLLSPSPGAGVGSGAAPGGSEL